MEDDRRQAIEARAYQLWEETGHPHGMQDEHWRQAEREFDEATAKTGNGQTMGEGAGSKPTDDVTSLSPRGGGAREDTPKRRK